MKKLQWKVALSITLILVGFIILTSGKPMKYDPSIINPTIWNILGGVFIMLVGIIIGGKKLKEYIDEDDEPKNWSFKKGLDYY